MIDKQDWLKIVYNEIVKKYADVLRVLLTFHLLTVQKTILMRDKQNIFYSISLSPKTTPNDHDEIFIGYWLDMKLYVRLTIAISLTTFII